MSDDRSERSELLYELYDVGRDLSAWTVMFHQAVAERAGLTVTDHKSLDLLIRLGPCTAGQLAELTGLTTGAITGVVDRLEKAGFVRRERDAKDRRKVIVRPLYQKAKDTISPILTSLEESLEGLAEEYDDQKLRVIVKFLRQAAGLFREETAKLRKRGVN